MAVTERLQSQEAAPGASVKRPENMGKGGAAHQESDTGWAVLTTSTSLTWDAARGLKLAENGRGDSSLSCPKHGIQSSRD